MHKKKSIAWLMVKYCHLNVNTAKNAKFTGAMIWKHAGDAETFWQSRGEDLKGVGNFADTTIPLTRSYMYTVLENTANRKSGLKRIKIDNKWHYYCID